MNNLDTLRAGTAHAAIPVEAAPVIRRISAEMAAVAGAMATSPHRAVPPAGRRTRLESFLRGFAARIGNRDTTGDARTEHSSSGPQPLLSATDLLERFDHIYADERLRPDLARYMRRDAEAVRIWLHDVSQPAPPIAAENLCTWAIPHLLEIVKTENRRRAAEFRRDGSNATSATDSFMEGVEALGLHQQEKTLADLLEDRTPLEERLTYRLAKSIQEKARIEARLDASAGHHHRSGQAVIADRMAHRVVHRQRRKLVEELTQIEQTIHLLREDITRNADNARQRRSEIKAYQRALHRSFRHTVHEATDELSELQPLRQPALRRR